MVCRKRLHVTYEISAQQQGFRRTDNGLGDLHGGNKRVVIESGPRESEISPSGGTIKGIHVCGKTNTDNQVYVREHAK
jgi:hypothetical protein